MEAARILYPHLQVRGVRQVRLMDMIQCPPGIPRPSRSPAAGRHRRRSSEVVCEVSLATQEISPPGDRPTASSRTARPSDPRWRGGDIGEGFPDFPVRMEELRTRPMDHKKVLKFYTDHSGLEGRYRVMEALDGAGHGVVRAGPSTGRQVISHICGTHGTNTLLICSRLFYSWSASISLQWTHRSDDL